MTYASLIKNRVAIVTGAAAGIGESIAETFAGHGALVVAIDKDEERVMAVAKEFERMAAWLSAFMPMFVIRVRCRKQSILLFRN